MFDTGCWLYRITLQIIIDYEQLLFVNCWKPIPGLYVLNILHTTAYSKKQYEREFYKEINATKNWEEVK